MVADMQLPTCCVLLVLAGEEADAASPALGSWGKKHTQSLA